MKTQSKEIHDRDIHANKKQGLNQNQKLTRIKFDQRTVKGEI